MLKILGISGSLRKDSYNSALLRAAVELAPAEARIEMASIAGIELYNWDVEKDSGLPEPVVALKERIVSTAALLLVTPEYNHSIPGVFKNAIDWLSRPPEDIARVFGNRPVGLIGATPGAGGTRMAQTAWLPVFRTLGMQPWFGKALHIGKAGDVFKDGRLADSKTQQQIAEYLMGFVSFVQSVRPEPQ